MAQSTGDKIPHFSAVFMHKTSLPVVGGRPQEKLSLEPKRGKDPKALACVVAPLPGGETGMSVPMGICAATATEQTNLEPSFHLCSWIHELLTFCPVSNSYHFFLKN